MENGIQNANQARDVIGLLNLAMREAKKYEVEITLVYSETYNPDGGLNFCATPMLHTLYMPAHENDLWKRVGTVSPKGEVRLTAIV
tara:strand:- start:2277 stop:2534 length:258 start_codon:yes stop_codon:yes gene_type:complete